jgi:hypothetical protein
MSTTVLPSAAKEAPTRSEVRFPVYDLGACVAVAKAIHEKGGGSATDDHLAAFLGYKSANNGAFINRLAASKLFGLIEGGPSRRTITQLAQKILMPIRDTDPRQGLVDAFMRVPLYSAVYEEYKGKELPPEFGLKNALRTQFGVTPKRIDRAYSALIDSAETAGFFDVRGSRTQLIMPAITPRTASNATDEDGEEADGDQPGGGAGGGGGRFDPPPVKTKEELQNEYVGTLIALLREKGSEGDSGADLMARIEKLLGLAN